ncbi:MAG TPA: ATP-binding cassette domain-containing protein, partial [Blastocatellia bacterium]
MAEPRRSKQREPVAPLRPDADPVEVKIKVADLNFYYGRTQALFGVNIEIPARRVTAFIGPSGCGKSTLLRSFNRMNDLIAGARAEGLIEIDGENILARETDVVALRRKVGMVFQKSNPFPKSIYENVAYGLRVNGIGLSKAELDARVEDALRGAAIWDEVKDR